MKIIVKVFLLFSYVSAFSERECMERVDKAKNVGFACSKQLKILCSRHDILFTLWDASTKIIRSGLTAASSQDLGDYDLCMKIDTQIGDTTILGNFCPYQWVTSVPKKYLEQLVAVIEVLPNAMTEYTKDTEELRSDLMKYDTNNITLIGSLCISDGCSPDEFNEVFSTYLYPVFPVHKYDCFTKYSRRELSNSEIVATFCLILVVFTMVSCTIFHVVHHYSGKGKLNDFIKGFSAFHNGRKLISINTDTVNQIQCMNGLRFISMLWIIAGHGYLTAGSRPLVNQEDAIKWKKSVYSQYIQSAIFAVDTFFFLSGFLLAYGYLKQVKNCSVVQQIKGVPLIYLNRYIRLTPAVGAMFLTSVSFYKIIGDGPMWFLSYDLVQKPCTEYWWRFFLYIQNYFPNELCFTQTWYLSADMQMFIFAPLVLIPVSRYRNESIRYIITGLIILIGAFMGITIAIRYMVKDYSNNYDTHSRVSGYLVGVIGGVIFHKNRGKQVKINEIANIILWASTLGIMIFLVYCNYYVTEYDPSKLNLTLYVALYRPIWCTCILWIVFSCYHGYGGFINWFLSNSIFQVGARLSYCMYVLHGMTILYSVGTVRTSSYFADYEMISIVWGYINNCIILSIFWTLAFEGPMIMFNRKLSCWIASTKKKNEPIKEVA